MMTPARMAKVEEAARIGLAWHAALARGDVERMTALLAEDCVWESASPAPEGTRVAGRAAIAAHLRAEVQAVLPAAWRVEGVAGFGRHCVVYWRSEGGETTECCGVDVFEVRGGLVVEIKSYVKA